MAKAEDLLTKEIKVINIGLESFAKSVQQKETDCIHVDWTPPARGNTRLIDALFQCELATDQIDEANDKVVEIMMRSQPVLQGIFRAGDVIPGLNDKMILHAGPPVDFKQMCSPMQGAVIGAMIYVGWAANQKEAEAMIHHHEIVFDCNHHHQAVGPMTGIITASMPVFEVENKTFHNRSYCTINEGIGEVMRFGANGPKVIEHLHWLKDVLAPVLNEAIHKAGGLNLRNIMAQALAMGDEMHQRNTAASLLFYKSLAKEINEVVAPLKEGTEIIEFLVKKNDQFFLNLAMASGKCICDAASGIEKSTIVTALSRNGVDFGIRISSLKDRWFTAPVEKPVGLYFPGFSEEDANPDMGDSSITECIGLGGCAMGCSPAVVNFIGAGSVDKAIKTTHDMGKITVAKNYNLPMPNLNFEGVPLGFDIRKIVETSILPVINTGMAHRQAGIGQVGAGIARPPLAVFEAALLAFVDEQLKS